MDMTRFYREEDLFPCEFTHMTARPWGYLFHNEENRDSYDSNHALIFRDRTGDLPAVLAEITAFYRARNLHPVIYQSILDSDWFEEIAPQLSAAGYRSWPEEQTWMLLSEPSRIMPDPAVVVRLEDHWQDAFAAGIFEAAGEPWEIPVVRRQMQNPGTRCFVAWVDGKPAGMIYGHVNDEGVCRIDYLLVAPAHRGQGVGRALTHAFVQHAGFRFVESRMAGRASWQG